MAAPDSQVLLVLKQVLQVLLDIQVAQEQQVAKAALDLPVVLEVQE
jgi:hypothetical protein